MKKTPAVSLLLFLLLFILTVPALADMGPKPQLTVYLRGAPEASYYLDLLYEGDGQSLHDNLPGEERAALDASLLAALRAAKPEGWSLVLTDGTVAPCWGSLTGERQSGDTAHHTFSYMGLPKTYRVLVVTAAGDSWLSPVLTRPVLQSSLTVDWASKTVIHPPVILAYGAEFLATCLPTLLIEGLLLLLFGFSLRRNGKVFLLVNLATQLLVFLILGISAVRSSIGFSYYLLFFPTEIIVAAAETLVYHRYLTGQSRRRAVWYGVTANICSAALGFALTEPVWRLVSSFL